MTSQTTTATTSTAAPSDIPAAARAHTPAGAVAFVRHFIDQTVMAWTGPRTGLIPPLSEPSCKSCASFEAVAVDLAKAHQRYEHAPVTISDVHYLGKRNGLFQVFFAGTQEGVRVLDASGEVVRTEAKKPSSLIFELRWGDDHWTVAASGRPA